MISIHVKRKLKGTQGYFELDISETIDSKVFLGIYGKSGMGKTTLLRLLSGLDTPDSGTIKIDDHVWFDHVSKTNTSVQQRNIGYVFQEDVLFPNMTVYENLCFAVSKNKDDQLLEELIYLMELKALLNLKTHQLSGGQKQRISLTRALIRRPKLLLLDEPLSALDYEMRKKLQLYIKKVHVAFGLTTVFISHDPVELYQLSDQVWHIDNGNVINKGNPKDVLPLDMYSIGKNRTQNIL